MTDNITSLAPNEVFVFGSNLAGRHGADAGPDCAPVTGSEVCVSVTHQPSWLGVVESESADGRCWMVRRPGDPELWEIHKSYVRIAQNYSQSPPAIPQAYTTGPTKRKTENIALTQ